MAKDSYAKSGVNYDLMDPFKRLAQKFAAQTAGNANWLNFKDFPKSRGESVYLLEGDDCYLAHVEEGLGTKNLVADAMYAATGQTYYDRIGIDAVAAIVNDMITLGAYPVSLAMHLAAGDSGWFSDRKRYADLINGWKKGADLARCVWGGGETPTLKNVILPDAVAISGSAVGIIKPKKNLMIGGKIKDGDAIIMFESSGIHANGLTLARKIAGKSPKGYLTKLGGGQTFGEALLAPSVIYVPVIEDCLKAGIPMHYAVHITGHGWRKLMRANEKFEYIIDKIPPATSLFNFLHEKSGIDNHEAYGNFNMGAGFAVYVPHKYSSKIISISKGNRVNAWMAGSVYKSAKKKVIIRPLNVIFEEDSLKVRK